MHTNLKAVALFLMAALYPVRVAPGPTMSNEDREEILYDTVGTLLFSDEQKADLYARLAEQLKPETPRPDAMAIVEHAIHACQYPG